MSIQSHSILNDQRVQSSLRRLSAMGLIYEVIQLDENRVTIIIDTESILRYITRAVETRITYPNKKVVYDNINNVMKIYLWRGGQK